jgi:short-subunit dehydrogenase
MKVDGARIVITGGSRGIGAAMAALCAARGARVALVARSQRPLEKLAADLGGDAYPADLSDRSTIDPLIRRIEADGPIDVLVNNAGLDLTGALTELPVDDVAQLIAVNMLAPILLSRAVLPGMLERGRGHILNVSSLAGSNLVPGLLPYSTSKAGLNHFTAGLRAELKATPITTTLAEIGPVESTMMDSLRSHEPTRRAVERFEQLYLAVDLDINDVAAALVSAIESERRHVRMPKRDILFPLLTEAPRRMSEWRLAGVR